MTSPLDAGIPKSAIPSDRLNVGLLRLKSIIGPNGRLPISKSLWWSGVKSGRFPAPVKLGPRVTCWRSEDIQKLIDDGIGSSKDQQS
jgi:prophage regulatory protein